MKRAAAAILALGIVSAASSAEAQRASRPAVGQASETVRPELAKRLAILTIEDARYPTSAELKLLVNYARGLGRASDTSEALLARRMALRALGRFERRDLIPVLTGFLNDVAPMRREAELGLLLTLRAHARSNPDSEIETSVNGLVALPAAPVILGQLPYTHPQQFENAENRLRSLLNDVKGPRAEAARALEALARRNRRLGRLNEETISLLRNGATRTLPGMTRDDDPIVYNSMAALLAAGEVDAELIASAFREDSDEVRRLGALALYGAASIDAAMRTTLTQEALKDPSWTVRYEALRAWIRREASAHGCGPIVDALLDPSTHIALAAIDALGERCPKDESITVRLASQLRTPPTTGEWHREAHAVVAIARRDPERAATALPMFTKHPTWQVRMYAATAASLLKDADTLNALAYDDNDNVRHAALPPLRVLKGPESDGAFIAALDRDDYQLLLSVATTLKGAPRTKELLAALVSALDRVTSQKKETSRDTRLALIERIAEQGGRDQATVFERLLTDYDPEIAALAAAKLTALTGRAAVAAPRLLPRPPPPTGRELEEIHLVARVELDTGRFFDIACAGSEAPLAFVRFVRLVRSEYYDGLTFHRVVPNFVVQGGSPQANEYGGAAIFMRDEIGYVSNTSGTVGLSTRGRDTGDAQFFVNLVDNGRLDFDYTVFGKVVRGDGVDTIQEGTTIRRIRMVPPPTPETGIIRRIR
jgi:cyclophilin family peptidyl-prolyl cis-trans isomerase